MWSQVRTSTAPSGNDIADGPGILGVHDDGPVAAKPSPMTRHSDSPHRNDIAMLGPHPARVCTICEPALGQAAQPREPRAPGLPPSDEATGRRRRQAQRATPVSGIGVRPATDTGSLPDGPPDVTHVRFPRAGPARLAVLTSCAGSRPHLNANSAIRSGKGSPCRWPNGEAPLQRRNGCLACAAPETRRRLGPLTSAGAGAGAPARAGTQPPRGQGGKARHRPARSR